MNEKLGIKDREKTKNYANQKFNKKQKLALNTLIVNSELYKTQNLQSRNELEMKKTQTQNKWLQNQGKFTVEQVSEFQDFLNVKRQKQMKQQMMNMTLKSQHKDDLNQIEARRLYLDPKQVATSNDIMKKINPKFFDKSNLDSDGSNLEQGIEKFHKIITGQEKFEGLNWHHYY